MLRNLFLALGAVLLTVSSLSAQRQCGTMEVLARQLMEDPEMQQRMLDVERHTEKFMQDGQVHERAVVTIPVVFNIVWNVSAENVSDAQIATQLQVLNDDFRRLNADASNTPSVWQSIAADCEINFCMAQQDPNGNATNGIRRQNTSVTSFSTNDAMKFTSQGGLDIWDRNKYLNIWVCDLGGGILGYAQFPGSGSASTDGVVIDYQAFGTIGSAQAPFNLGRTATHEVGHWLNLFHIWGDDGTSCSGTDNCGDTPNQADEHYQCPTFPQVSCSNGPNGDMFMNYMDYTDDACMNVFTLGQKTRMQAVLGSGGSRQALASSPGCNPPTGCSSPSGLSATNIANTSATLNWGAVSGATSYNLQWKLSTAGTWTTVSNLTGTSYGLSGLTAGTTYNYQVQTNCSGTLSSYSSAASFTTTGGSCADVYEPNESRNTAKVIPVNTTFTAQIRTSTDKDHYKFSNSSSTPKIKVDLTNLPFDYDLKLYRSNSLLGTSQQSGTLPEQLIYNTTTISSNYIAYVYGYNGAFSSTQCYTFRVSLSASNWREDGSTDGPVEEIEIPVVFENAGFGLFPNPASSEVTVEVPVTAESDVQVSIIDPSGKVAISQHRVLAKGDNRMQFDVSRLATGMYFVQVRNGGEIGRASCRERV